MGIGIELGVNNLRGSANLSNAGDRKRNNTNNSEENLGISSKMLQDFMVNVMKGFEILNAKIQAQIDQVAEN
jgi:hypothetical protein